MAASVQISTIADPGEFEALGDAWDGLVRSMARPSPFLLNGWLTTWWRHFGAGSTLQVVVAMRGSTLVGAIPLMVTRRAGMRVTEFVGGRDAKFCDLVVAANEDPDLPRALITGMSSLPHDLVDLVGVQARSMLLPPAGPRRLRLIDDIPAPRVDVSRGWDVVYKERASSKARYNHRRRQTLLSEAGRVDFRVAKTGDALSSALEGAFVLHALRWRGRPDLSYFGFPAGRAFHRDVVGVLAGQDCVRILTLTLDGRPVAFNYYLVVSGRLFMHRIGFDPALSRYAPGITSTLRMLEVATAEGVQVVEFMGGDNAYKMMFADRSDPVSRVAGLANGPRGAVWLLAIESSARARRLLRRSETVRRVRSRLGIRLGGRSW